MVSTFAIVVLSILGIWASQTMSRLCDEAPSLAKRHEQWMHQYGRTYASDAEKEKRFKIFKDNVNFIEQFNKGGKRTYKLNINKFADFTNEEVLDNYTGLKKSTSSSSPSGGIKSFRHENVTDVPTTVDWSKNGAVTPVKQQGQCGM